MYLLLKILCPEACSEVLLDDYDDFDSFIDDYDLDDITEDDFERYKEKGEEGYNVVSDGLVESSDGFFELYINHNSKYYLSSTKLPADKIVKDLTEELDNNTLVKEIKETKQANEYQPSKTIKDYLVYIILGAVLIVCIIVILVIVLKRKKLKNSINNI